MRSKVTFTPLDQAADIDSRYLVVDISTSGMDIAHVDDDGTLPDGHANKNLAVLTECSKRYSTAILCLLQLSEDGTILMKSAVGMVSQGVVMPPPQGMQPIHLLVKKDGKITKVNYVTLPFKVEHLTPQFERLLTK